jgi:putative endonuclease
MSYYVYILQSLKDGKYYIGSTSDVQSRLNFDNAGLQRSTKSRIPFKLILVEIYNLKEDALKREKQIKSWKGGEAFQKLIAGKKPRHRQSRICRMVLDKGSPRFISGSSRQMSQQKCWLIFLKYY